MIKSLRNIAEKTVIHMNELSRACQVCQAEKNVSNALCVLDFSHCSDA